MSQITGRAFIKHNGKLLRSKAGAKLNLGGVQRNTVKGDTGVHGFSEETAEPSIECTISHGADTSLSELADITDASITFETDTGKVYILRNAWVESPPELTAGEGEVPLRFVGISCEEQ